MSDGIIVKEHGSWRRKHHQLKKKKKEEEDSFSVFNVFHCLIISEKISQKKTIYIYNQQKNYDLLLEIIFHQILLKNSILQKAKYEKLEDWFSNSFKVIIKYRKIR